MAHGIPLKNESNGSFAGNIRTETTGSRVWTLPDVTGTVALENIATASVTGATSLDATAFNKLHLLSGTSADYTVDLPPAVGNAGGIVAFKGVAALTKAVTIVGVSGQTIDGEANRKISTLGLIVLMSDGTNWVVVNEVGSWIPFTTTPGGFNTPPTFLSVVYMRVGKTCTVKIHSNTSGTGGTGLTTLTFSLPFTALETNYGSCPIVIDGGTVQTAVGICRTSAGSSILSCFKDANPSNTWAVTSTNKSCNVNITYIMQ